MQGSIRKRGDKWSYQIYLGMIDGKKKYKSKTGFKTKKECQIALQTALLEYNNAGSVFQPSECNVSEFLDYYFENYAKMNLKHNTQIAYEGVIRNHLKPRFGMFKLKSLSRQSVQEFINELKLKGYNIHMIKNIICTLSAVYKYAIQMDFVKENPCLFVKYPKQADNTKKRYIITTQQFNKLYQRFKGSIHELPLLIGYYTGLRIAEVYGLTWNDIDLKNDTLTVNKILVKYDTEWFFGPPKTPTSNRTISFGKTLHDALESHYKAIQQRKAELGINYHKIYKLLEKDEKNNDIYHINYLHGEEVEFVNVKYDGSLVTQESFKYAARIIHYELNMKFNFHSLRHTHATMLIEHKANIKDVQTRLGHSKIQTTLDTYTHDTDAMKKQTVDIFEKLNDIPMK